MNQKTPFIERFKTDNKYYIYDVNTNRILLVNEIMYEIIPLLGTKKEDLICILKEKFIKKEVKTNLSIIENIRSQYNLFSSNKPKARGYKFSLEENFILEKIENEGPQSLVLETTQQCNLRCKYCAYSGCYPLNRVHNSNHMSVLVAKKAVDFYISKAKGNRKNISFYGGEPLIRESLIKYVVDYLNILKSKNKKTEFSVRITTNGTLLNIKLIDFFIKNEIALQVSLDGPKKYHDEFRLYKNGRGTFIKVIKNLENIYNRDQSYYKKNVMFNCVISPVANVIEISDFFHNNFLTKNNIKIASYIDKRNTNFFDNCEHNIYQIAELQFLYDNFLLDLIRNENKFFSLLENQFEKRFIYIHKRNLFEKPSEFVPIQGPCFPGIRKLFVSANGTLHICEKINPRFSIGDVDNGLNIKKIKEILDEFKEQVNSSECLECWAMHFCNLCFAMVANSTHMKLLDKDAYCRKVKQSCLKALTDYAYLLEENPKLINRWNKVTLS